MNKQDIIKALDEGTNVCVPLFLNPNDPDWQYVKLEKEGLKNFLRDYPEDKIFPCEISPFKSCIFFSLPEDIDY